MPQFGSQSTARLQGVHPRFIAVLRRAIEISPLDWMILEGVRSNARQHQLYGQGRSQAELKAKGVNPILSKPEMPKVTWTLTSNHFVQKDGFGRAVDVVPYPVDWNTSSKFDAIAASIFKAADELGEEVRWGADWDQDGNPRERGETDSPHFEIVL